MRPPFILCPCRELAYQSTVGLKPLSSKFVYFRGFWFTRLKAEQSKSEAFLFSKPISVQLDGRVFINLSEWPLVFLFPAPLPEYPSSFQGLCVCVFFLVRSPTSQFTLKADSLSCRSEFCLDAMAQCCGSRLPACISATAHNVEWTEDLFSKMDSQRSGGTHLIKRIATSWCTL